MKAKIKSGYGLMKMRPWKFVEETFGIRMTVWQKLMLILPVVR